MQGRKWRHCVRADDRHQSSVICRGVPMERPHEPPQSTLTLSPREDESPVAGPPRSRVPVHLLIFLLVVAVVVGSRWYDLRTAYHDTLTYWNSNLSNSADQQISFGN